MVPISRQEAGPVYVDAGMVALRLTQLAADRMLWGSDWPLTQAADNKPDAARLLDDVTLWIPDQSTRHRIPSENPAKLYGFRRACGVPAGSALADVGNRVHLHEHTLETSFHGCSRGLVLGKSARIERAQAAKERQVGQIGRDFDDVFECRAGGGTHTLDVGERGTGPLSDRVADRISVDVARRLTDRKTKSPAIIAEE